MPVRFDPFASSLYLDVNSLQKSGGTITGTTQSTDKDTGCLILEGGIGVEKNANIGGAVVVTGTTTLNGKTVAKGTATNDSAAAGYIGEVFTSSPGGAVTPAASGSFINVTSMDLTAGDWDVEGFTITGASGTTATKLLTCLSTTSNSFDSVNKGGIASSETVPANGNVYTPTGTRRFSLSGTTTVYLTAQLTYSVLGSATYTANSYMRARRMR